MRPRSLAHTLSLAPLSRIFFSLTYSVRMEWEREDSAFIAVDPTCRCFCPCSSKWSNSSTVETSRLATLRSSIVLVLGRFLRLQAKGFEGVQRGS